MLNLTHMFSAVPAPIIGARFVPGRAMSMRDFRSPPVKTAKRGDLNEAAVLAVLSADEPMKTTEVAIAANVPPSSTKGALDRLELSGKVRNVGYGRRSKWVLA